MALEEEGVGGVKQQGGRGEQHQHQEINEVAEETEVPVCWTATESHLRRRVAASASSFIHSSIFIDCRIPEVPSTKFTAHRNFFLNKCPNKINKIHHNKVLLKKTIMMPRRKQEPNRQMCG